MSPDITHKRIIKQGDTLALMTQKIYNDQHYYMDVANVNRLDGFRKTTPGTEIFFPPIK